MRIYTFETQNKKERDKLFEGLFNGLKELEVFKTKNITLDKREDNRMYYTRMVVADEVAGSIFLAFANTRKDGSMRPKVRLDSNFGPDDISIPNEININITWEAESHSY